MKIYEIRRRYYEFLFLQIHFSGSRYRICLVAGLVGEYCSYHYRSITGYYGIQKRFLLLCGKKAKSKTEKEKEEIATFDQSVVYRQVAM